MASEIQTRTTADINVYAVIRNSAAKVWNGSAFVTFVDADWMAYDLALTEQGTSSGFYTGDFPASITAAGRYSIEVFKRAASTPSITDLFLAGGTINWDGSAETDEEAGVNLTTLAVCKDFLELTVNTHDAFLLRAISQASDMIQRHCQREFPLTNYTETYSGMGTYSLCLTNYPVTALSSVSCDGTAYDLADVKIDRRSGILEGAYFPNGHQNISVTYSAGFAIIPYTLQNACALVVSNLFHSRGQNNRVASERIGDWNASYKPGGVMTNEVLEALAPFRRQVV